MTIHTDELTVSAPGVRAMRWSTDELHVCMKDAYAITRIDAGRSEWWSRGQVWRSAPGSFQLKQPGDVHRDIARDGPGVFQVILLPAQGVERVIGKRARVEPQLSAGDERARPFERLHAAVERGADRLALEVAVAEAIAALGAVADQPSERTRPVRRAVELLHARLAEAITLDDLAAHAGLDKYHLCRAFRAQVGMPPHAYLTRLRILRAKALLAAGVRPRDVAPQVGLYDQSQLNRHFRRIVGTTPGQYARAV
ncbi:AraC family transcriptional regulator [Sorangium sp. So ce1036]|uniref:helix-turn-helix transcriptional regulator n=1 Tax=Sorangium sp. So ce1036 TaxID=3133328 RepID=UPI003F0B2B1C